MSPEFCFLDGNFFSRELVEFVPWLTASFLLASQLEAQNRRGPWTLGRLADCPSAAVPTVGHTGEAINTLKELAEKNGALQDLFVVFLNS